MSTAAPCNHCFCKIDTAGNLRCHRCGASKPFEQRKESTCLMCGGTGKTRQAYDSYEDFDIEPSD